MSFRNRIVEDVSVYEGFWRVRRIRVENEMRTGPVRIHDREVVQARDGAGILLHDPERDTVLLVRQFRAPAFLAHGFESLIEACAGLVDAGETPEACVVREAVEELGVVVSAPRFVGHVFMSPGVCMERLHLFIATYNHGAYAREGGGVEQEGEEIAPVELPFGEAMKMVESGEIIDAKTVILLQRLALDRAQSRNS